jgi:hypothetical protein
MANQAMIRITVTAIHRNISTMKFGIARNHFTSGSHRFRSQSPVPQPDRRRQDHDRLAIARNTDRGLSAEF